MRESKSTLENFVKSCPNVQLLHMDYLEDVSDTVMNQLSQGEWRLLRLLPSPRGRAKLEEYCKVALKRQNTLQSLTVWAFGQQITSNFYKLVDSLSAFKNLKHLEVQPPSLMVTGLEVVLGTDNYYPQLEKITLSTCYQRQGMPMDDEEKELSLIRPYPNVKIFRADRMSLTEMCVEYMAHKFPSLDYFSAKILDIDTTRAMKSFQNYISKIGSVDISIQQVDEDCVYNVLNGFAEPVFGTSFPKIVVYFGHDDRYHRSFLDQEPLRADIRIRHQVSLYESAETELAPRMSIPDVIYVEYKAFPEDLNEDDVQVPDISWLLEFKDRVEEIELSSYQEILPDREEGLDNFYEIMASFIDDIIGECYLLKKLSLDSFTIHGYTPAPPPFHNQ